MDRKKDNKNRKTFAFDASRKRYQSGWTSDNRRYSLVTPETIISSTDFKFKPHKFFDEKPGSYNASHVEAQALCRVREGTPIVVSRKMCDSCVSFVEYLSKHKKLTHHVGTPDSIQIFSAKGITKTDSAKGKTSSNIEWSMHHQGHQTTMLLTHPDGEKTEYSVMADPTENGPIATETHTHWDNIVEKATHYQSKDTSIETRFPSGTVDTRVGPSNGVKDCSGDDKWKRVPKRLLL